MLEADLQREYGIDLTGLWRGSFSLRRLRVLVSGLPPDCRTATDLVSAGDPSPLASWRLTDVLLGRLADELALLRWQWESAHLDPKKGRPRPQPPSVLPAWEPTKAAAKDAPLVSPHRLGGFVNEDDSGTWPPYDPEEVRHGN